MASHYQSSQSAPAAQLALRPRSKAEMAPCDQPKSTPQSAPAKWMTLISAPGDPLIYSLFGPPSYKEGNLTRYTNSRLLTLPLELRKTIYEYAVTYPGGFRCVVKEVKTVAGHVLDLERVQIQAMQDDSIKGAALNPIKLCSRQLYGETSGLLLKSNGLYFSGENIGDKHFTAWTILQCFLQQAKAPNLKLLSNITLALKTRRNFHVEDLFRLLNTINQGFCAANPNINVCVQDA